MKQESKKQEEQFDKFNEPRTIPGQWDVSAFHSLEKSSDKDRVSDEYKSNESSHSDSRDEEKNSEPSGIKYLDPDYDDDTHKVNRKWSAY